MVDSGPGNADLQAKVFFIWGGCCVLCFLFVYFVIPETMGLSLEQVDILYRNSSIRGSLEFRKQILADNIHDEDGAVGPAGGLDRKATRHEEERVEVEPEGEKKDAELGA